MQNEHSGLMGRMWMPLFLFVITTVYLVNALMMAPLMVDGEISVSFFPIVIAVVMYVSLGFVMLDSLRGVGAERKPIRFIDPLLIVVLTAAYIAVFKAIGYVLATVVYVYGLMFVFGYVKERPVMAAFASAVVTGIIYLLFAQAFQIRLPKLEGLF